jgi:hypothetical protein
MMSLRGMAACSDGLPNRWTTSSNTGYRRSSSDHWQTTAARFRVEFHDEPGGRTGLEIRQWLPAHLTGPSNQGWLEALDKLDATLLHIQAVATAVV